MDTHNKIFWKIFLTGITFFVILISCGKKETKNNDSKIISDDSSHIFMANQFYFVAKYGGRESLYRFDFKNQTHKLFWFDKKDKVIELLPNDDYRFVFFITARRMGIKQGIPYIKGIKLYLLNPVNSSVTLIDKIDEAVQLFAEWDNDNFHLQYTSFDLNIASQINKVSQIYSRFGKLLDEKLDKFDIIREGYPSFKKKNLKLISPSGAYGLAVKNDSLILRIAENVNSIFIDSTEQSINRIKWIRNERYVIFSTVNKDLNKQTKNLQSYYYIVDLKKKKTIAKLSGNGRTDFFVINNLLIYDEGTGTNKSVIIYDFKNVSTIKKIHLYGGCSLISLNI